MANLLSVAELAYRAMFPESREKTSITREEFIATAKTEYAAAMWIYRQEMIAMDGYFDMSSGLLTEVELDVEDGKYIDISGLRYLSVLPGDLFIQNIGGVNCECPYVKSTINLAQLLCEDDSMGNERPFYIQGKKIIFPKGTHAKKLPVIYANTGSGLDAGSIEVDDYVASIVRRRLRELYSAVPPVDQTNNQNSNQNNNNP